jgi:drug/metabolite transporter (DMT)-like permease
MQIRGFSWGLCAAIIWGGYLAFARAGIVAGLDAFDIAFVRFATAGFCLAPWFFFQQSKRTTAISWPKALMLAFLVGPPFVLLGVGGFEFAPLAHGALLQPAALMVGSIVFAVWILNESITFAQIWAVLIIMVGLAFVVGPALVSPSGPLLLGNAMFITSALMWALFATLQRLWAIPPVQAAAAVSVISGAVIVPPYLIGRGLGGLLSFPTTALLSQVLVHGILVGIVAVVAFTKSVAILGTARAACFPAIIPAIALLIGIPLTGETPTSTQWLGLVIITLGLFMRTDAAALVFRARTNGKYL